MSIKTKGIVLSRFWEMHSMQFFKSFQNLCSDTRKSEKKICFWQKTECSPFGDFGFFGHFFGIIGIIDIINWFFINLNSSRSVYILKSSRKKFKIVFKIIILKKKKNFFFGIPGPNPWCPSGTRTDDLSENFQVHGSRPIFWV